MDKRVSLWDIQKTEITIGGYDYVILKEPDRGASCLVYQALWRETVGKKTYDHRVLLKEFYPILRGGFGITRNEDGTLEIPDYVCNSEEYKMLKDRFQASYATMLELANVEEGAEFLSIPTRLIESQGTLYLQEEYDSGTTLEKMCENKEYFDLPAFLEELAKCMRAVARLHHRGYYHLDLKPKNISFTTNGTVKLFDTDTFVKADDLDKQYVFMESKGYSAPELHNLLPEDAPELIGPWTDVYSLTQIICWYIYGRPLEEDEVDEKLEEMAVIIRRYPRGPGARPSGIYMLQQFIKRNLSLDIAKRNQTVGSKWDAYKEAHHVHTEHLEWQRCDLLQKKGEQGLNTFSMHDEIMVIQRFLKGPLEEPDYNFKDSRKYVPGYENELEDLGEFMRQAKQANVLPVLSGEDALVRERLARYYVTQHKWEYSIVTEVHCDSFNNLWKSIPRAVPGFHDKLETIHVFPWLLVIFDECMEDAISQEEVKELNKLLALPNCCILIVGKYNRCLNKIKSMDKQWGFPTIEVHEEMDKDWNEAYAEDFQADEFLSVESLQKVMQELEETGELPRWSWLGFAGKCLLALVMFIGGLVLCSLLADSAPNYIQYDRFSGKYEASSWGMINVIMIANILAAGVSAAGIVAGIYRVFELVSPMGWWYFVRKYHRLFPIVWAAQLAMNIPEVFRGASYTQLIGWIGIQRWLQIEDILMIGRWECILLYLVTIGLWIYRIVQRKMGTGDFLEIIGGASMLVSCLAIVVQTLGNSWELLLFGMIITIVKLRLEKRYG